MRLILTVLAFLGIIGAAYAQTLIGNCGTDITGIQLSTGNIYCIPPPITACGTGVIDLTTGCSISLALGLVP